MDGLVNEVGGGGANKPVGNPVGFLARFNHPIFGTFATSWLVWNWEIPYTIFRSPLSPKDTIAEILTNYLNTSHIWNLLWLPALATVAFLLMGPIFYDLYLVWKKLVDIRHEWLIKKMEKLKPVPYYELERSQRDKQYADREAQDAKNDRAVFEQAYSFLTNNKVLLGENNMDVKQLITSYKQYQELSANQHKDITNLKADLIRAQEKIKDLSGKAEKERPTDLLKGK